MARLQTVDALIPEIVVEISTLIIFLLARYVFLVQALSLFTQDSTWSPSNGSKANEATKV